jgi:hypothetical protein
MRVEIEFSFTLTKREFRNSARFWIHSKVSLTFPSTTTSSPQLGEEMGLMKV